ncbi:MAG: heavy metal-binding domain-containing protein [Bacteroidota bacterium]
MKHLKIVLISLSFTLFGAMAFTACGHSHDHGDKQGKEYTSAYICPMYCDGSGSDEMGQCPVCGMDYVKNEDQAETPSNDAHDHHGHDHGDHSHDGHSH